MTRFLWKYLNAGKEGTNRVRHALSDEGIHLHTLAALELRCGVTGRRAKLVIGVWCLGRREEIPHTVPLYCPK